MIEAPSLLADFLASQRAPAGSLSMLALDGYLTALHVGPSLIRPSEWMAGVWGSDPIFDDMKEAQSILDALMLHYNAMGAALTKGRKQYRPYGWPTDDAERASTETAAEWSFGFWKGRQNEGGASPRARPMLSVVSDFPTGHGERDQCYRDHGGYRRAEHQIGHVNGGQSFEHAGVGRFELLTNPYLGRQPPLVKK
jgi:Uncharacterised protein family (UPF0149)